MSAENYGINEDYKSWNPMKEAYTNEKFNNYVSGPGANLNAKFSQPYLMIKNVPPQMTKKAMFNLCASFGQVLCVDDSVKNNYYYVRLPSVADMEAVYRGLENNTHGFQVLVGKSNKKEQPFSESFTAGAQLSTPAEISRNDNLSKYRTFGPKPERPYNAEEPIVTTTDYEQNPLLRSHDPQRQLLIEHDAHELERAGLVQSNGDEIYHSNYKYRTGRAYMSISDNIRGYLAGQSSQFSGACNEIANNYQHGKINGTLKDIVTGTCAECHRGSDTVCARCGTYYCNTVCQKTAWPKHRQSCGKPRNTISQELLPKTSISIGHEILPDLKMPRSGDEVAMTTFSKTNVVFIRSKSQDDDLYFFRIISEIHMASKGFKPVKTPLRCGQVVTAAFQEQFNRAMILKADNLDNIKIIFIDYGNVETKSIDELYELPEHLIRLPRVARPVILKDVPDTVMTDEVRKIMKFYLVVSNLKIIYTEPEDFLSEKGVYKVELIDVASNKSLNEAISACMPIEPLPGDTCKRFFLRQYMLPVGDNIELVVMDNSVINIGYISCTTKQYSFEIQKISDMIQNYAKSIPPREYAPPVDGLCIAKYSVDQKWYRGLCLNLAGDGFPTIVFIDYGNIDKVPLEDIRPYPHAFTHPIYTCDCEIEGISGFCNESTVQKLKEHVQIGSTIVCDNLRLVDEDTGHSIIKMKHLIEELKTLIE